MNSLNESASLNVASSPPCDPPASPMEIQPKETIGSIAKAYQDIFPNAPDRLTKRAAGSNNGSSGSTSFQSSTPQESSFSRLNPPATYHTGVPVGYTVAGLCPRQQMSSDNKCPLDNSHYQNHAQSNQIPCQSTVNPSPQANYGSSYAAGEMQAQTSCPWKLVAGSKVLVRTKFILLQCDLYHNTVMKLSYEKRQKLHSMSLCIKEILHIATFLLHVSFCLNANVLHIFYF